MLLSGSEWPVSWSIWSPVAVDRLLRAPAVTYLGTVAELTQQGAKTVGAADGSTFLGLDIGS